MGGVLQAQLPHISEDGLHVQLCDQLLHVHRGSRSVISLTDNCFYGNYGDLTGLLVVWYQTLKSDSSVVSVVTLSLIS